MVDRISLPFFDMRIRPKKKQAKKKKKKKKKREVGCCEKIEKPPKKAKNRINFFNVSHKKKTKKGGLGTRDRNSHTL